MSLNVRKNMSNRSVTDNIQLNIFSLSDFAMSCKHPIILTMIPMTEMIEVAYWSTTKKNVGETKTSSVFLSSDWLFWSLRVSIYVCSFKSTHPCNVIIWSGCRNKHNVMISWSTSYLETSIFIKNTIFWSDTWIFSDWIAQGLCWALVTKKRSYNLSFMLQWSVVWCKFISFTKLIWRGLKFILMHIDRLHYAWQLP